MANYFVFIALVAITLIVYCTTGSVLHSPEVTVTKRSDGLIRDLVRQMVAEHLERNKILDKFHKIENQLDDIKRELKEKNKLLQKTKFLQKKLRRLVTEFKKEARENTMAEVRKALTRFREFLSKVSNRVKEDLKVHKHTIYKKMSFTNQKMENYVKSHEKNIKIKLNKTNKWLFNVKQKNFERMKLFHNELLVLQNQFAILNQTDSVAFSVKLNSRYTTTANVIFKHILFNIGGYYHSDDGIFYCPKDGIYMFSVSLMADKHINVGGYIMKNDVNLAYTQSSTANKAWPSTSLTLMVQLKIGDRVWVKGTGERYYDYSYFSGSLIRM